MNIYHMKTDGDTMKEIAREVDVTGRLYDNIIAELSDSETGENLSGRTHIVKISAADRVDPRKAMLYCIGKFLRKEAA